jgi:hypothetical protein
MYPKSTSSGRLRQSANTRANKEHVTRHGSTRVGSRAPQRAYRTAHELSATASFRG